MDMTVGGIRQSHVPNAPNGGNQLKGILGNRRSTVKKEPAPRSDCPCELGSPVHRKSRQAKTTPNDTLLIPNIGRITTEIADLITVDAIPRGELHPIGTCRDYIQYSLGV